MFLFRPFYHFIIWHFVSIFSSDVWLVIIHMHRSECVSNTTNCESFSNTQCINQWCEKQYTSLLWGNQLHYKHTRFILAVKHSASDHLGVIPVNFKANPSPQKTFRWTNCHCFLSHCHVRACVQTLVRKPRMFGLAANCCCVEKSHQANGSTKTIKVWSLLCLPNKKTKIKKKRLRFLLLLKKNSNTIPRVHSYSNKKTNKSHMNLTLEYTPESKKNYLKWPDSCTICQHPGEIN